MSKLNKSSRERIRATTSEWTKNVSAKIAEHEKFMRKAVKLESVTCTNDEYVDNIRKDVNFSLMKLEKCLEKVKRDFMTLADDYTR